MKRLLGFILGLSLLFSAQTQAASTAGQSVTGYLDANGNFVQYSPTNPVPVTSDSSSSPTVVSVSPLSPLTPHQQITSATLATAQSLTLPTGTTTATINNSGTAPITYTSDGTTTPTASVGEVLGVGGQIIVTNSPAVLTNLKFIRVSAGAQLDVDYFHCTAGSC